MSSSRLAKSRIPLDHEETDTEGSWAVSYGDMVTLLLTFFIVFFTIDPKKPPSRETSMRVSLMETLKSNSQNQVYKGETNSITVGPPAKPGIDPRVLREWGGVVHDRGDHVIVEFPGVSFYPSGQTDLTADGQKALQKFVSAYLPYAGNYDLSIRAFADPRPVKHEKSRRYKDNLELTALRSVSAMRSLQKAGIPLSHVKVGGYGEMLVTARDLESIPKEQRGPAAELDLARKVVLVIEPEVKQ